MSEDFELSPSQRSALADFIGSVAQDTGFCDFEAEGRSDLQLVVLGLMAADISKVTNLGEFFLEQFDLAGIDAESLRDFLASAWAQQLEDRIRVAGGGPN
jgi:hypothetical protein